ncbi:hypothetical protein BXZ70DRAFT_1006354 [Cristinia sonorae]|uniref:WW domain-containing protein n=1 Tax=Cristinia sonorae TaxID=1940300 RepID=A0A8K0URH4_9AGAR|nr:hypothetical protein BXZ70DRAFT_1006354 [Cristinia sonorae]
MDDLPHGWVQQYDAKTDHPFWVDTNVNPPRSIWVHPYMDDQFLNEHPDIRARVRRGAGANAPSSSAHAEHEPTDAPPPYSPRRHSFTGEPSHQRRQRDEDMRGHNHHRAQEAMRGTESHPGTPRISAKNKEKEKHRGFFGKMKDKAIGTKEEREEDRRREMIAAQRFAEQRRQQRMSSPYYDDFYGGSSGFATSAPFGTSSMGRQTGAFGPRMTMYAAPTGNPYGFGQPGYGGFGAYGNGRRTGGGFGGGGFGGGMGLPLLGGLAGGLLLGDILDGGMGF